MLPKWIKNGLNDRYVTQELNKFRSLRFGRDYPREPAVISTRLVVKLLAFVVSSVVPIP